MPLHDWKDERGWDGVHLLWLAQLLDWIQPRLPPGFRAYVGSVPALTLEAGNGKPDVSVRQWKPGPPAGEVAPGSGGADDPLHPVAAPISRMDTQANASRSRPVM